MNVVNGIEIIIVIILTILIVLLLRDRKKLILRRIVGVLIINLLLIGHLSYANLVEKPTITLKGTDTITIEVGTDDIEEGATVTYHNKDWTNQLEIQSNLNTKKVGNYEIEYKVKFREGYVTQKRKVQVVDTTAPEITLKGNKEVTLPKDKEYLEEGYSGIDKGDGEITDKVQITKQQINETEYSILYSVADSAGNKATAMRTIHKVESISKENRKGVIFLTFDDGPSLDMTPKVLDILKEEQVKATFFIIDYDQNKEGLVKRIVEEGHTIGIHGYSHEYNKIYTSVDAYMNNITKLQDKIVYSTGVLTKYTRFPGGSSNTISKKYSQGIMSTLTKKLLQEGYRYFDWNVSSGDAGGAKTKEEVYQNVTNSLKKNRANMVLMHDSANNYKTLDALKDIIQFGKEKGYIFENIGSDTPMITQKVAN